MQDCSFDNILKKKIRLCEDCDQCSEPVPLLFSFYMHVYIHRLIPAFLPQARIGQLLFITNINWHNNSDL